MRIQCDVCEQKPAAVICCADEAALCVDCDVKVHQANKLASKHKRLPLMASNSKLSRCDICQDKTAFVFCLEDRAMLCRDCDESVHSPDTLAAKHQRFLATGIRVALSADISSHCENEGSTAPIASNSAVPATVSTMPSLKKSGGAVHQNYVEPCWSVDDLLPLSDFDAKGDQGNLGDFDWNIADMTFLGEEEQDSLAQVPQLSSGSYPSTMNVMSGRPAGKSNASSNKGKSKATQISQVPDYDEACFVVPDIGMLETGCLNALPSKRMRRSSFQMYQYE
ncbi:hypothetical protein SUGI_0485400 [Cryptomeria japonica]|uniref:B-box zinc finger protein 24 n=1 Tax=Cryptomeria japonica TaxID=3369 RepID=UPI002408E909|nr:B-box zinc finger protein 24 [Cryptomeria japonica]GLJ25346.1 hypothetical protein SUGI_0485400 [Cryptomeria japonica]